jgi:hypothetical protein
VSDKLRKQIDVERQQLRRLLEVHQPLLDECASRTPTDIELSALAFFLETLYSGIENIFKRIAIENDGGLPQGDAWHRKLLDTMASGNKQRPPVFSDDLKNVMEEYLSFRHVSRYSYSFHLQWNKMARLVLNCQKVLQQLEIELEEFLKAIP